ncbi:oxidoreductase, putative [Talaromyces stipitatus ATCC 10500]|uniref:Oxidoreductase, putative n=1 Tax=Talaromyces stipitatus (strain ATCC 10500 / CBS 375.48 / QM 6759 / NRRL 1006) TaxID=441959 RepID=B8MQG4_TALSN|nr:oxidoreductase, putative [Talaromyces stipitatus ATCC 10500]EED13366.1 oxidoreductase, putative [Talaromyces stipitatus ATCC 10500]
MKVFVTGASGYIGLPVVRELLEHRHEVLALARNEKSAKLLEAVGVQVHRGTLDDHNSLAQAAAASDGVIHLAFKHDNVADYAGICADDRVAVTAMLKALEGSNKPFVFTSGTLMMERGKLAHEDDAPDMTHQVSRIRGANEAVVLAFAEKGVRVSIMRVPPINHGKDDKYSIGMLFAKAQESGVSTWPAIHLLDIASLFRLALEKGKAGSVFHAVAEEGVRLKDIAAAIGKQLNIPVISKPLEEAQEYFGFMAFALHEDNPTSSEKTRATLGWTPNHPTLFDDIEAGTFTSN